MATTEKRIEYWVVVNRAAHEGFIAAVDLNDPNWTQQDICGPHGHQYHTTTSEADADRVLAEYLKCDSVEKGSYCYSHNRFPSE